MSGRKRYRRGLSAGSILTLTLTALVLIGFFALLPKLTGNVDIRMNASELAVAIDDSISLIARTAAGTGAPKTASEKEQPKTAGTLPPESLPTAAPVTPPPVYEFTLCLAGRVDTNQAMQKALTDDTGYRFGMLFDKLGGEMGADLSVCTLLDSVVPTDKLSDMNAPADLLAALKAAGANALCLGHPGALDGGADGLLQTKQSIADAGMLAYGASASAEERESITLINANGVSVALLSFQNDISSAGKKRASAEERELAFTALDMQTVAAELARAREAGAQAVVASVCWGKANASAPTKEQRELAQLMADAGADIIIGTGSEAVQTVEILTANRGDGKYHPTLCAYSMGNLVTYNRDKGAYLAGILLGARVEYDSGTGLIAFDELTYTPTYCWRGKEDGVTRSRVLISNREPESFVDENQRSVMGRCLKLIREAMDGGVLTER